MAKSLPHDKLAKEINKILEQYGDDVKANVAEITKEFAKKGAKAVGASAKQNFGGTGKYAAGWTSQYESGRTSAQGTIYNKMAGLPHLLENGHAKRGGGRVSGRPHISPVEEQLVKEYTEAVKQKL